MAATWVATVAAATGRVVLVSVQAATEADPAANDGIALESVASLEVWAFSDDGETFSGGGYLRAWRSNPLSGAWAPYPVRDMAIPDDAAGEIAIIVGSIPVAGRDGRFALIADGVAVSGGGVTLHLVPSPAKRGNA